MRRIVYGKIHPLREAFQEGKAQDGLSQTADLGRAESGHQKAGKQQGIQQKKGTGLEAGTAADEILCFFVSKKLKSQTITEIKSNIIVEIYKK